MNEVEKNLIRRIATGSKADFESVYKEYFSTLMRVASRITGNENDAYDITQDLFQHLWRNRDLFGQVDTDLKAWLKVSIKYASIKHLAKDTRAREMIKEYMQQQDTFSFIDMEGDSNTAMLYDAINQLSPRQQEIIRLHKLEEMSHADIANKLNISEKTARNTIVNAYSKLKHIFKSNDTLHLWGIILWVTLNIMEL
ncbi:sigma-70 family RNA polymerase sigma factor [Fulvivirgaceae bacterium PWU5]|uniref:Sigma-70 family RNA polymerase sigma factor n=1 Tax=Dawidia cretensis TaxID=2782350 RepID=A0AAP2GWH3_9BACT|nr:sigma-70 family RNA polymerase sigma factor [Dawidia cretensis]MBT1712380.1 sigma-70 family RNA polymerase sigma factor [Dawidia cretensis]